MDGANDRIARLERRLAELEGQVGRARRQRRVAIALGTCGVAAALVVAASTLGVASTRVASAASPQPLTVREPLRVVDSSGALVLQLDATGVRYYRGGVLRAGLGATAGGQPEVQVEDAGGQPAVELRIGAGSGGEVVVDGQNGSRAQLGDVSGGSQTLLRFFRGSQLVAGIGASSTGGLMQVNDASGRKMALVGENGTSGTVAIYNSSGANKALLAANQSGAAELDLLYDSGTPAVQLAEHSGGGYLGLTNHGGTARVEAGVLPNDEGVVRAFGPTGFNFIKGRG